MKLEEAVLTNIQSRDAQVVSGDSLDLRVMHDSVVGGDLLSLGAYIQVEEN